jgi:hypothetical protein
MSTNETARPKRKLLLSKEAVRRLEAVSASSALPANGSPQSTPQTQTQPGCKDCQQDHSPTEPPPNPRP